jgi:hypothetical protein
MSMHQSSFIINYYTVYEILSRVPDFLNTHAAISTMFFVFYCICLDGTNDGLAASYPGALKDDARHLHIEVNITGI